MSYGTGLSPSQLLPIAEIYSSQVMEQYQSNRRLQGVILEQSNVGGGARHDWIGGKTEMDNIPFGAAVLPTSNMQFTPVVTVPLRFTLKTAIAMADQTLTNVDLRSAHTQMHGLAAARMVDLLIINAIFNNPQIDITTLQHVLKTVGPNTGVNSKKLTRCATFLNNSDVPMEDRSFIANSDQYDALMNDPLYNNFFTNNIKPLPDYALKMYANFQPRMLAKGAQNSIPITQVGDLFDSYGVALQFSAMKLLFNMPVTTTVCIDEPNRNYVIVTELVANANVMQKTGIVLANLELDANGDPVDNTSGLLGE